MIRLTLDSALEKYDLTSYELCKRTGIQYQVIDNYYKNKLRRYGSYVLERSCNALDCSISEIIEYRK